MDRRDMLKKAAGMLGLAVVPAAVAAAPATAAEPHKTNVATLKIKIVDEPEPIRGIGILRYPPGDVMLDGKEIACRDLAASIATDLVSGCILFMPSDRDYLGNYLWDFRIEAGDPSQVKLERSDKAAS